MTARIAEIVARLAAATPIEVGQMNLLEHAQADIAHLLAELKKRDEVIGRLSDSEFKDKIAKNCLDTHHDDRWCATCEARADGIYAFAKAALAPQPEGGGPR